jgi:hypothetical protein
MSYTEVTYKAAAETTNVCRTTGNEQYNEGRKALPPKVEGQVHSRQKQEPGTHPG